MHIRRGISFAGLVLGCALVLSTNAQCGEYLLFHYLLTPECPLLPSATVKQVDEPGEVQTEALPVVVAGTEPSKDVQDVGPAIVLYNTPRPVPQVTCLDGDLNKDGKVDGLDIQVLVNCLLQQQAD